MFIEEICFFYFFFYFRPNKVKLYKSIVGKFESID